MRWGISRKRIIFLMSILVIAVTLTIGIVGVLNFKECQKAGGQWSYEKKICEHNLKLDPPIAPSVQ